MNMSLDHNLILIGLVFLVLGLLTGLFARKFINITVFVLLVYVGMSTIEALGMTPSWPIFEDLSQGLADTGKTTIQLFTSLLQGTPAVVSGLFLLGGVLGLLLYRR